MRTTHKAGGPRNRRGALASPRSALNWTIRTESGSPKGLNHSIRSWPVLTDSNLVRIDQGTAVTSPADIWLWPVTIPNRFSPIAFIKTRTDILPSYIPSRYDPTRFWRAAVRARAGAKIRPILRENVQLPSRGTSRAPATRRQAGDFVGFDAAVTQRPGWPCRVLPSTSSLPPPGLWTPPTHHHQPPGPSRIIPTLSPHPTAEN